MTQIGLSHFPRLVPSPPPSAFHVFWHVLFVPLARRTGNILCHVTIYFISLIRNRSGKLLPPAQIIGCRVKTQSFTLFLGTVQKLELQSRSFSLRRAKTSLHEHCSFTSGSECTLYALLSSIGYHSLRTEQLETSLSILAGEDVIVRMSTAELSSNTSELAPCVTTTIDNNF